MEELYSRTRYLDFTMPDRFDTGPPPPDLDEELSGLALQLKGPVAAREIWYHLTPEEKQTLGFSKFTSRHPVDQWVALRGTSYARAVLELARVVGILSIDRYGDMLKRIGESDEVSAEPEKPAWNRDRCELLFRGKVVRQLRGLGVAKNVTRILDAFEEEHWPERIDDPLPGGRNPQRLRGALATLNRGLNAIRFRTDGSGEGIRWEVR